MWPVMGPAGPPCVNQCNIRCILDYMLNIIINIGFNHIHLATPTNLGVKGIVQIKELEGYFQRLLGEAQLRTFRAADFT